MATFTDILRDQRSSGRSLGGSIKTAFGERAKERLDPRNYLFNRKGLATALFPGLKGYQSKTGTEKIKEGRSSGLSGEGVEPILNSMNNNLSFMKSQFKIVAKNSIVLPQMARDTNITKRNIQNLVKLFGGKAEFNQDMFFQNRKKRESQYNTATASKASKVVDGVSGATTGIRSIIGSVGTSFRTMLSGMGNGLKVFGGFLKQSVIGLGRLAIMFAPEGALVLGVVALGLTIANLVNRWQNWSPYDDAKNAAKNALGINTNPPANNTGGGKVGAGSVNPGYYDTEGFENLNAEKGFPNPNNDIAKLDSNQITVLSGSSKDVTGSSKKLDKDALYIMKGETRPITATELERRREAAKKGMFNDSGGFNFGALGQSITDKFKYAIGVSSTNPTNTEVMGIQKDKLGDPLAPKSPTQGFPLQPLRQRYKPYPTLEAEKKLAERAAAQSEPDSLEDLGVNLKAAESTAGGPHFPGTDAAVQAIITELGLGGTTTLVTAINDKYHSEMKDSRHPLGLAADIRPKSNWKKYEKEDLELIRADMTAAGLNWAPSSQAYYGTKSEETGFYDGYAKYERKGEGRAIKDHLHFEFSNQNAALMYQKYAKAKYDIDPSDKAGGGDDMVDLIQSRMAKNKSSAAKKQPELESPSYPLGNTPSFSSTTQKKNLNLIDETKRLSMDQVNAANPVNIINNNNVVNHSAGDTSPAAPDVFDNALDWYFRRQLA